MITRYQFDDSGNTAKNVQDIFLNMTTEQVAGALGAGRSQMVTVCANLTSDFNKASVIRAHNAFLGGDVFIVGKRKFDRRGTVGTHHYENIYHADSMAEVFDHLRSEGYSLFAVDNTPEFSPVSLYGVDLPEKVAFVYGEEQKGLEAETVALCDRAVYIPQFGSVRSLNVAQAAAVVMGEYTRQHRAG